MTSKANGVWHLSILPYIKPPFSPYPYQISQYIPSRGSWDSAWRMGNFSPPIKTYRSTLLEFPTQLIIKNLQPQYDRVQIKTPHFSTRNLISVNYQVVSQLSQLIFCTFSCLNIAQRISVIEFCREKILNICFLQFYRKLTYSFVAIDFWLFSIM